MIKRNLGVVLDNFVLKDQRQDINDNSKEIMIKQQTRLIKSKRGKDKEEKEGRSTFMITTAATVQEVCVVEGGTVRESSKAENKNNREKKQAADNRAKKNRNVNDEGFSGGGGLCRSFKRKYRMQQRKW